MNINRRRLFACLAVAPVAVALPAAALACSHVLPKAAPLIIGEQGPVHYLPAGSWVRFNEGFKAAQMEWEETNPIPGQWWECEIP